MKNKRTSVRVLTEENKTKQNEMKLLLYWKKKYVTDTTLALLFNCKPYDVWSHSSHLATVWI